MAVPIGAAPHSVGRVQLCPYRITVTIQRIKLNQIRDYTPIIVDSSNCVVRSVR
jgi:hypothetical protein